MTEENIRAAHKAALGLWARVLRVQQWLLKRSSQALTNQETESANEQLSLAFKELGEEIDRSTQSIAPLLGIFERERFGTSDDGFRLPVDNGEWYPSAHAAVLLLARMTVGLELSKDISEAFLTLGETTGCLEWRPAKDLGWELQKVIELADATKGESSQDTNKEQLNKPAQVDFVSDALALIEYEGLKVPIRGKDRVWFFKAVVESGPQGVVFQDLLEHKFHAHESNPKLRVVTSPKSFQKQGQLIQSQLREKGWQHLWHQTNHGARWSNPKPYDALS